MDKKKSKVGKVKHINIHARISNADDLYRMATAMGLKDKEGKSRKMTNGRMTVNVVKWGQSKNFDEWYVTNHKQDGKTLVIIDEARKCTSTYKDLDIESIRLLSVPSLPPANGGWKWVT